MQRVTIYAMQGNTRVNTAGVLSSNVVEGSFPGCTVSVFATGTSNLATIFGDNLNPPTPKSNPFTADSAGAGFFYAANGTRVDIQLSGTGVTVPFTLAGDVLLDDFSLTTISPPSTVAFSATPQFDLSQADWFKITLTGNVTAPTFPNANSGAVLILSIIQDGVGSHTWAWPGSFTNPPVIASAANARTELTFKFDGTNWTMLAATGDNLQANNASIATALSVPGTLTATGNVTEIAGQNQYKSFKLNSVLWVDGIKYTTIAAAMADIPAGGGTICIPPGYAEVLSANLVINKSNLCIQFMGPATITLGAFSVTMASGINNVSIISPYIHGGTNVSDGAVTFTGFTGAGSALSFGDSSGFTVSLLIKGVNINLNTGALANAVALTLTNVVNSAVEYPWITFGGVSGQKGIRLLGTGAFFCGLINIVAPEFNSSVSATNNTGIFVDAITNSVNIYGGHANMGGGANGSTCIDVNGAASSGVVSLGFDADVCQTAVKVESASNTGFWGFVRCDSGTTNIANFAANSQGNIIWTNGNLPFVDNGVAGTNSVINPARYSWRTDVWQNQVQATFSFFYKDLTDSGNARLVAVNGVAGRTDLNSGSGAGSVNLQWDQGTGGVNFGNGDTTAHATMSGAGKLSLYNTLATAGEGVTSIRAVTSQKAESAADTNVLTLTPPAAVGTYRLNFVLSLSAANTATLGWTATWKDSNAAAQAPTNLSLFQEGTAAPASTFLTSAAGNYYGSAVIDIDASATNIVIKLTFSGTSFAGKASAIIERLI